MAVSARENATSGPGPDRVDPIFGSHSYSKDQLFGEFREGRRFARTVEASRFDQAQFKAVFDRFFAASARADRLSDAALPALLIKDYESGAGAVVFAVRRLAQRDPKSEIRAAALKVIMQTLECPGVSSGLRQILLGDILNGFLSDPNAANKSSCLNWLKGGEGALLEPYKTRNFPAGEFSAPNVALGLSNALIGQPSRIINSANRIAVVRTLSTVFDLPDSVEDLKKNIEANFRMLLRTDSDLSEKDSRTRRELVDALAKRLPNREVADCILGAYGHDHQVNKSILQALDHFALGMTESSRAACAKAVTDWRRSVPSTGVAFILRRIIEKVHAIACTPDTLSDLKTQAESILTHLGVTQQP